MKKLRIFLGICILIFVLVLLVPARPQPRDLVKVKTMESYSDILYTTDVIRNPASATIADASENATIGFNISRESVSFGSVLPGGTSRRQLNISTRDSRTHRVVLQAQGNISRMVAFSEGDFILNGTREVSVTFVAGNNTPGEYVGEVDAIISTSNFDFLRWFLGY